MDFSTTVFLEAITLRPHQPEDKVAFEATARDAEFYRMIGSALPSELPRAEEADIWFQKNRSVVHSWAIEVDRKCIGSVWVHSIEPENRRGRLAIGIFNGNYRGLGIGARAVEAIIKIAFEELLLHRLDLRVLTVNERAISCYERCGFKSEGVQRDTLYLDGEWYSDMWMSILEDEYRKTKDRS